MRNFDSFILKAMSLQYQNVMFAKVDVDESRVRILNPPCRYVKSECNVIESTVSLII